MSDSAVADPAVGESAAEPTPRPAPGVPDRGAPPFGRVPALLLAVTSGLLLTLAFPGYNVWPLAPIAVAGLTIATRGRRARFAAGAGYLFGLAFFIPHLHWSGIYVGAVPWFALAGASAVFIAALGALLPRIWTVPGGLPGTALAGAGLWVAMEAARDRVPFGGFPWGRLAFSQAEAPTLGLAALGGAPLVTAAVGAAGTMLAVALVAGWHAVTVQQDVAQQDADQQDVVGADPLTRRTASGQWLVVGLALAGTAVVLVVGLAVPLPTDGQTTRVAAVQGNVPRAGLDFNSQRRAVLDNHVRATLELAARVQSGAAKAPDLVIWPENASDIDPLRNPDAAAVIDQAVAAMNAPTLVGAVIDAPVGKLSNTSIVWRPGTGPGTGDDSVYVKRHPAPFAEYIPYRSFFRHFSTKVDLVTKDFVSGDTLRKNPVGVLRMGQVKVGDVICFEVAYDNLVRDPVKQGATLLAVQTNNATFGHSAETYQQLAMSQLRAVENGRTVVQVATSGKSAIIDADGHIVAASGALFTADVLVRTVALRTSTTLATRVGATPEWLLTAFAVYGALAGVMPWLRRRTGRGEVMEPTAPVRQEHGAQPAMEKRNG
jgi:apolipoprotein N-acyltransferase